jgi:hypothetical protein
MLNFFRSAFFMGAIIAIILAFQMQAGAFEIMFTFSIFAGIGALILK